MGEKKTENQPNRDKLPNDRQAIIHKFAIAQHEGYLIVGLYESGQPGELFIEMSKEGSTLSGVMDAFATAISMALQYGVPLKVLCDKFRYAHYEPSGFTGNSQVRYAASITDYIFKWLAVKYLNESGTGGAVELGQIVKPMIYQTGPDVQSVSIVQNQMVSTDAPFCIDCGAQMVRSGACYQCENCGRTSGCS